MSFLEAKEDGVRCDERGFMTAYYPLCTDCGAEVMSLNYIRGQKYRCKKCRAEEYFSDKERRTEINNEAKERKFLNAVKRMDKMMCWGDAYRDAARIVYSKLFREGWFNSTEEIMVAIELVKRKIKTRHQVKFGRYRADFVLPEEKVVLEIDGKLFHAARKEKDKLRDELIILGLGAEWEVIRISDDLINQKISRLMPAIRKIKKQRALHRKQYNGKLPQWYSDKTV